MTTTSVQSVDSGNDIRVLHVDGGFEQSTTSGLERASGMFDVETAATASEALAKLDTVAFDCIVSAYELPNTDGIEFLEAVRERSAELPFLLVTKRGSEAVASAAISAGVTDYFSVDSATTEWDHLADRVQRAAAEYRTKRAEKRMLELAENTDRLFYVFTGDWSELLFISSAYEEICGRPIEKLREEPTDFLSAVSPVDRGTVTDAMARVSGGEPIDVEFRVNTEESYRRWIRVRAEPIFDDAGNVVRIAGVGTDITEQRTQQQRRQRQRETLVELATDEAVTSGDLEAALQRITETTADVIDVDRVNVWLAEDSEAVLTCVNNYDRQTETHTSGLEFPAEEYPAYIEALETHRAIDATDARGDPRTAELEEYLDRHGVDALLDGTLRSEGEVVGVICHEHCGGPREWTDDEIEFVSDIADIVHRVLRNHERAEREAELRRERQQFEKVLDTSPVGITILGPDGVLQRANARAEEIFELESSEIAGRTYDEPAWEIVDENGEPVADENLPFTQVVETGNPVYNVEHGIKTGTGTHRWLSINAAPLSVADSEEPGVLAVVKDVTERYHEEQTLKTLHDRTQAIAREDTPEAIAAIAVETVDELLGFDGTIMYQLDGTDRLAPLEWSTGTERAIDRPPTVRAGDDIVWQVFVDGEAAFFETIPDSETTVGAIPFQSALALPVGNHGVLLAGTSNSSVLSTAKREAAHLIGETLDAALDRADREQRLRERDRALQRQNDQLEQLNRLNTIIRETTTAAIQSMSRSEIQRRVCEQIAAGAEYSFAWIGTRDETTGQLELTASAEMDPEYAEYLGSHSDSFPLYEMADAALRDETVQVARRILEHEAWTPYRRDVLNQGYRSVAVVPIVVQDRVESLLVIHGTTGELFDEREQAVLAELGDTIGYAVQNLHDTEPLEAGTKIEIELSIVDPRLFSNQIATALGSDIEVVGVISTDGDEIRAFLRFPSQPAGAIEETIGALEPVRAVQLLADDADTVLAQVTLETPQLVQILQCNGVRLRSLAVDDSETTVTALLSGDVRLVVEEIQAAYPETELQARRDDVRPIDTADTFRDQVLDELTEKQFDALQTALYGGFYEWPRTSTREELAATRDIASSTFSHHLRAAERKLLSAVLDSP